MGQDNTTIDTAPEFPEELKVRAREFFSRGSEVAYALQYDYAIEMYLDGLSFWPEAVEEGHGKLREIALRRNAAGGKKSGFGDGSKYKKASGKNPKDAMLKAEYLLSKDPMNLDHMAEMAKAAVGSNFNSTASWISDILLDSNLQSSKPSFKIYVLLRDIYKQIEIYSRAVQACQLASQVKPGDSDLADSLRDLSARATLQKGRYEEAGDFRDSIKDKEDQAKLHSQGNLIRSEDFVKDEIAEARKIYDADPNGRGNVDRLVKALCDSETTNNETEARKILEKAYKETGQFSYKQRSGDILIKQWRRQTRMYMDKYKQNPQNQEYKQKHQKSNTKLLEVEISHYRLCVENYPTDKRMKFELGKRLLQTQKIDEAIPLFQEARTNPRHRTQSLNCIGQCFFSKGWFPDAVESFQQAYDLLDNKEDELGKELVYNLGRSHEADENIEEALNCYRKVAQIDFNFRDARDRVDSLRKQQRENDK